MFGKFRVKLQNFQNYANRTSEILYSSNQISNDTWITNNQTIYKSCVWLFRHEIYALNKAPVYREGFPVYEKYVSIPEERAVRISSERVSLLDANGNLCLGYSSISRTLKDGLEKNLVELKTTVIYKTNPENVHITILYGVNNTISLEDIKDKNINFTVTILARYNVTVLRDTDCTQVEKQINGTMIEMYETNPNFISQLISVIVFSVFFLLPVTCGCCCCCFCMLQW